MSDSSATLWTVAWRLLCPWGSPGKNTGAGCHFLLQGIFLTQGSNPGLLHWRWILYHLNHQGGPRLLDSRKLLSLKGFKKSYLISSASLVAQTVSVCLQCGRPGLDPWVGKIPWRRKWQPTPVLLPGKFCGLRNLVGYSPWGHRVGPDWVTSVTHSAAHSTHLQKHCSIVRSL